MPSENFIFSSNPANGAVNRSADGSRFTIQFSDPFFLPDNSYNSKCSIIQSNIWNVSPNISPALQNNILQVSDNNGVHTIQIETGLYDLDTLATQIAHQVDNIPINRPAFPFRDMVNITGNESTNRLYIEFKYNATLANLQFIWQNSTVRDLMGFNATSLTRPTNPSTATTSFTLVSEDFPKFNQYNSFVIHSTLVNQGIRLNNSYDSILCQIPIRASVGELDSFRSQEPSVFSLCNNLIGTQSQIWSVDFWLTSETNIPLDQRGEYWDFVLLLSWLESDQ